MNMEFMGKLHIPKEMKEQYHVPEEALEVKAKRDEEIAKIFDGRDKDRMVLIIGPC